MFIGWHYLCFVDFYIIPLPSWFILISTCVFKYIYIYIYSVCISQSECVYFALLFINKCRQTVRNRQTKNKQTHKQTNTQTHKQTNTQADKQTNTQTHKQTNTQADKHTNPRNHANKKYVKSLIIMKISSFVEIQVVPCSHY